MDISNLMHEFVKIVEFLKNSLVWLDSELRSGRFLTFSDTEVMGFNPVPEYLQDSRINDPTNVMLFLLLL